MTKLRIEFLAKNARANESQNTQGKKSVAKSKGRALSPERSVLAKRERSDPDSSPEDGTLEDADLLGMGLLLSSDSAHISSFAPGRATQRRKPNLSKSFRGSRLLSESSAARASIRQSNIVHRSILQRTPSCSYCFFFLIFLICWLRPEAWHVVTTVDAFFDSDEEDIDESSRHAYSTSRAFMVYFLAPDFFFSLAMRLQVLNEFHQNANTPIRPHQRKRASAS